MVDSAEALCRSGQLVEGILIYRDAVSLLKGS